MSTIHWMTQTVKNLPAVQGTGVRSLGQEDPLEGGVATHSSVLPGGSHGQGSLTGSGPWGPKEADTTERLTLTLTQSLLFDTFFVKYLHLFSLSGSPILFLQSVCPRSVN